jgi:hypothetical protein
VRDGARAGDGVRTVASLSELIAPAPTG